VRGCVWTWLPPIDQLARCGRRAGCWVATAGHRASCHQPWAALDRRRRPGGRAPSPSRAWAACSRRWVMCCSASAWLSPACWLCMSLPLPGSLPACSSGHGRPWLLLASSGWRRSVHPRIRHLPYANTHRFPIFGRWLLTAAVSLRPVTRDNPGEMGGRVASPTLVGRIEELELLEAARVRAADGDRPSSWWGARPVSARPAWSPN
jgi:hypothetical protein